VAIFFLAFLPQFVDKASGHVTLQMIPLGLTFSVMGLAFLLAVAYSSGSIGGWVTRRPEMARAMQRVAGGVLVGLGVRLAGRGGRRS
jgi:threonine/homoserine/homoserine lactone efflux protein